MIMMSSVIRSLNVLSKTSLHCF